MRMANKHLRNVLFHYQENKFKLKQKQADAIFFAYKINNVIIKLS